MGEYLLTDWERKTLARIIEWKSFPVNQRNRRTIERLESYGLVRIDPDNRARHYARPYRPR